jgi:hypothetical protein
MRKSSTVMSQSLYSTSLSASVNINSNRSRVALPLPTVKAYVSESERNSLHQLLNQMENPHTVDGGDNDTAVVNEVGGGDDTPLGGGGGGGDDTPVGGGGGGDDDTKE